MPNLLAEPTEAEKARLAPRRGCERAERAYSVAGVELRANAEDDNIVTFEGHASVTNKGYDMYGGPDKGGWTEYVDSGAFKKTLSEKPDVAFLVNHMGITLARTKSGTLKLSEDSVGLKVMAELDKRVSVVNDISILMQRGDLDEMSFAFRVTRQAWLNADGEEVPWWDMTGIERHIREVSLQKGDVSVVNYGANPHTDAKLRSLDEAIAELTADRDSLDEEQLRRALAHLESLLPKQEVPEVRGPAVEDLITLWEKRKSA